MKKSVWLAALLAAGLVLSYGCGGGGDDNSDNGGGNGGGDGGGSGGSLVGTWINYAPGFTITFNANGRWTIQDPDTGTVWDWGDWSTNGNQLTFKSDYDEEATVTTFSVSGNTLTTRDANGDTATATRV